MPPSSTPVSPSPSQPSAEAIAQQAGFAQGSPHLLFSSNNAWEVQALVAGAVRSHRLQIVGAEQHLHARMHHANLGSLALSRLSYGTTVTIEPDPLEGFYLVQMPLAGQAYIQHQGQQLHSTPLQASILNPDDEVQMRWLQGNDQLMLRIPRALVEHSFTAQFGHPPQGALQFERLFAWRHTDTWLSLLSYLASCCAQGQAMANNRLLLTHIEQLVAATLLSCQPHNLLTQPHPKASRTPPVLPRHIRQVQDFLQAHAHEPIDAARLAAVAGISLRSLYAGFQNFVGCSPMQYLRQLRLERAHEELRSGQARSVTAVALRWGFAHPGRFSREYQQRFGQPPSQTLQKS